MKQDMDPADSSTACDDDYRSVNLLEDDTVYSEKSTPPPSKKATMLTTPLNTSRDAQSSASNAIGGLLKLVSSPSPATKTLANMSQGMDDLMYETRSSLLQLASAKAPPVSSSKTKKDHQPAVSTMKPKPAKKASRPQSTQGKASVGNATAAATDTKALKGDKLPHDVAERWDVIPIEIAEKRGQLGITILKATFPEILHTGGHHCQVKSINKSCLAEKYGIQIGDWIGTVHGTSDPYVSDFNIVQDMARRRPFQVHLFRPKTKQPPPAYAGAQKKMAKHGFSTSPVTASLAVAKAPLTQVTAASSSSPQLSPRSLTLSNLLEAVDLVEGVGDGGPPNRTALPKLSNKNENNDAGKDSTIQRNMTNQPLDVLNTAANITSSRRSRSVTQDEITKEQNVGNLRLGVEESPSSSSKKRSRIVHSNANATDQRQQQKSATRKAATTSVTKQKKRPPPSGEANSKDRPTKTATTKSSDDAPKFCLRCNATSAATRPRMHHAWCHRNEFYDNSGASDFMERIRQGRELDCPACEKEFETGKPVPVSSSNKKNGHPLHNSACIKNQKYLKKLVEERENREEEEEKKKKNKKKQVPQQPQKSKNTNNRAKAQTPSISSPSSSEDEGDDNDEISEYRPRRKRKKSQNTVSASTSGGNKRRSTHASKSREKAPPSRVTPQSRVLSGTRTDETMNGGKPVWTKIPDSENPWGPAGHTTGDALLYGPLQGLCNTIEAITSSQRRYIVNPFSGSSNYRRTHVSPDQGLAVLVLQRGSMGNQPWGFQVTLDEFGQACLVKSVDPLSPAESATILGMSDDTTPVRLATNDMILLVNGKQVGGMSQGEVDAEIEASGRVLLLAVSRYKHARDAARKIAAIEQQVLGAIDSAARDRQVLGWMEVGHGSQESNLEVTRSTLVEDCSRNRRGLVDGDGVNGYPKAKPNDDATNHETGKVDSSPPSQTRDPVAIQTPLPERDLSPSSTILKETKNSDSGSEDWEEDENPWMGCVCGVVHDKSKKDCVFWIQCDSCQSWYDVSENCVGFDSEEAEKLPNWVCWACPPLHFEPTTPVKTAKNEKKTAFEVGKEVERQQTGPNSNEGSSNSTSVKTRGRRGRDGNETVVSETLQKEKVKSGSPSKKSPSVEYEGKDKVLLDSAKRGAEAESVEKQSNRNEGEQASVLSYTSQGEAEKESNGKIDTENNDDEETVLPSPMKTEPAKKKSPVWRRQTEQVKREHVASTRRGSRRQRKGTNQMNGIVSDQIRNESPATKSLSENEKEREIFSSRRMKTRGIKRKINLEDGDAELRRQQQDPKEQDAKDNCDDTTVSPSRKVSKRNQMKNSKKLGRPNDRRKDHEERTTPEGYVRPRKDLVQRSDGTYPKPSGRPFVGKVWDETQGLWRPKTPSAKKITDDETVQSEPSRSLPSLRRELDFSEHDSISSHRTAFRKGDLVFVDRDTEGRRKVFGGVGHIAQVQVDRNGDLTYRVKYVVGGSEKDIQPGFIKFHSF